MAENKNVHPAAEALSYELDNWDQNPEDTGWYFTTVNGVLIAERHEGGQWAAYGVDLADIPFTEFKEAKHG